MILSGTTLVYETQYRSHLRHYATSRKVAGSIPDDVIGFFNWPNHSSCNMAWCSIQALTEMNTRSLHGNKGGPARKTDKVTVNCERIFYKMWEFRRLTNLWAFTASYRNSFTFLLRWYMHLTECDERINTPWPWKYEYRYLIWLHLLI
jgi:hypothetical protein